MFSSGKNRATSALEGAVLEFKQFSRSGNVSKKMHPYRTHTCGELREDDIAQSVRLSGWVHRKRDHGNLVFIDVRDHYGLAQCVIDASSDLFPVVETVRLESVVTVSGPVVARSEDTING